MQTSMMSWTALTALTTIGAFSAGCGSPTLVPAKDITGLHFSTTTSIPSNPPPPVDISLTDSAPAGAIYSATLALPDFPAGIYHCPADGGVRYTILFADGQNPALTAVLNPAGCGDVTITGSNTRRILDQTYWALLARNLGIELSAIYPYRRP